MDIAVRNLLLTELKNNEEFNQDKPRLEELADFLTSYVRQQFAGDNPHTKNLAEAQRWTALAYTKPELLSGELLEAIKSRLEQKNWKELFRLSSLVETFAEPLAEFAPLLITYARGMASFTVGDVESATEQFSKLPRRDRLVHIDGESLYIPDEVPLTTVKLDFLLRLLRIISDSDGDIEKLYSALQENLDKLDASFADLLREYAEYFIEVEEPEQARAISQNITTLSNILLQFPLGSRANNLEIAIYGYEIALEVHTREAFPQDWAEIQNNLGIAYRNRITAEKAENIETAISSFQAALEVYTREAFPQQWGITLNNLGNAYRDRIRGENADNIEAAIFSFQAALEVYTREAFPQQWGITQNNLGNAYSDRIKGEKAENIETAISSFQAALEVYTREAFPQDWATIQNNLGLTYKDRIRGKKAENIEVAISAFQAALDVRTREAFPQDWAMIQNNLGNAYSHRIKGEKAENIETAISAFQAALEVYTREAFPKDWAETQNNLGLAYKDRIRGEKKDNIEAAISTFQAALEVRTREAFPKDWAETQNNLGLAYKDRIRGEKKDNIEAAISACQAALEVRTREAFPQDWAAVQNNLGTAYGNRIRGERAENLETAIGCFLGALEVYTPEAFTQKYLENLLELGLAYQSNQQFNEAYNTLDKAITDLEYLRELLLPIFSKNIYQSMVEICLKLGYTDKAVEYVERSKARSLVRLFTNYYLYPKGKISDSVLNELQHLRLEISMEQLRLETKNKHGKR
jgi:tetratricopeptide (TPR) repeat protein